MKLQFTVPHGRDGCLNKQDIINFIGDTQLLNNTRKNLKDTLLFSPNVANKFYEYFEIVKLRGERVVDSKWEKFVITEILNKYPSENDLLAYLNELIVLASKRTPEGKYFINGKYASLLADVKNLEKNGITRKKALGLRKIFNAIEMGELPPSAISDFCNGATSCIMDCSEFNPLILDDIEKFLIAKGNSNHLEFIDKLDYFIPEYDNVPGFLRKKIELKPGSVVGFKHSYWGDCKLLIIGEGGTLHYLNVDRETLLKCLPPIGRYYLEQGHSGTCYQLAGYISMMQDPHFFAAFVRMLRKKGDDIIVTLPYGLTEGSLFKKKSKEFDEHGHLYVKLQQNGKFTAIDGQQCVTAKGFYKALEHLYGKYRKYSRAEIFLNQFKGKSHNREMLCNDVLNNINNYIYNYENGKWVRYTLNQINQRQIENAKKEGNNYPKIFKSVEDYYKEGGNPFDIMDMFTGFNSSWYKKNTQYNPKETGDTYCSCGKIDSGTLKNLRTLLEKPDFVKTFSTIKHKNGVLFPQKGLYSNHAYSVLNYDSKTDIVKYINPWNSLFVFEMKLSELAKYIGAVSIKKIV